MAVDMATLKATTFGDPETKLSVKRGWLAEVHRLLEEGAVAKRKYDNLREELARQGIQVTTTTIPPEARKAAERDIDEGFKDVDKGMDKIFGQGGAFSKIFGKRGDYHG